MMIPCHSCSLQFKDYKELALHISSMKKGHRKGKMWAAKFLARNTLRADKPKRNGENPDQEKTEFGDDNREKAQRQLTGEAEYVYTECPNCKLGCKQLIPIEYINSPFAWRNEIGTLIVSCPSCMTK